MDTLIYTCCLGLLCLVLEVVNLRRLLVPAVVAGLGAILALHLFRGPEVQTTVVGGMPITHMLGFDRFSSAFHLLGLFVTALFAALAGTYYRKEAGNLSDYLAIMVFILCGAMVLASFNNLVMMFLGIEIVSISLYILAGSRKFDLASNEAGFKYFLMGAFASGVLLFGMALLYGASHSFELSTIATYGATAGEDEPMYRTGVMLITIALCFKVAAVPFHFWSPDVYEGSPSLITALMATLVKVSMFAGFYRFVAKGLGPSADHLDEVLVTIAIATMLLGSFIALQQQNVKRILAYSGIANAGYMMLAILSARGDAAPALFFYGTAYILGTLGAFAAAIPVFHATGRETVGAFDGLAKKNPWLAVMMTLSLLSIAGIPPMAGFLGKYFLFAEAIGNGYIVTTIVAILASVVAIYYYFGIILAMYTKQPDETDVRPARAYWGVLAICVVGGIVLGVAPGVVLNLVR